MSLNIVDYRNFCIHYKKFIFKLIKEVVINFSINNNLELENPRRLIFLGIRILSPKLYDSYLKNGKMINKKELKNILLQTKYGILNLF